MMVEVRRGKKIFMPPRLTNLECMATFQPNRSLGLATNGEIGRFEFYADAARFHACLTSDGPPFC